MQFMHFLPQFRAVRHLSLLLVALCVATACSDETPAEAFRQDLVDVRTGRDGSALEIITDLGERFAVTNAVATGRPDTTYRAYAMFVVSEGHAAALRNLAVVPTDVPRTIPAESLKRDPVEVQSLWRGGRYLNFQLAVPVSAGSTVSHVFGFVGGEPRLNAGGGVTLPITLHHDSRGDGAAYTRRAWLCCRLDACGLSEGDSLEVSWRAADGTLQTRRLAY